MEGRTPGLESEGLGRRKDPGQGPSTYCFNLILPTNPGKLGAIGLKVRMYYAWDLNPGSSLIKFTYYDLLVATRLRCRDRYP